MMSRTHFLIGRKSFLKLMDKLKQLKISKKPGERQQATTFYPIHAKENKCEHLSGIP